MPGIGEKGLGGVRREQVELPPGRMQFLAIDDDSAAAFQDQADTAERGEGALPFPAFVTGKKAGPFQADTKAM